MAKASNKDGFSAAPEVRLDQAANENGVSPSPPLPLHLRAASKSIKGLNKRAITIVSGAVFVAILGSAALGLSSKQNLGAAPKKPLMSDPARPEMAKGRVADLPSSYADLISFAPTAQSDYPVLGPAMAGDIPAPADANAGSDMGIDPASLGLKTKPPGAGGGYPPRVSTTGYNSGDEVSVARKSGLFFALRDKVTGGLNAAPSTDPIEAADRELMTSPHSVLPAVSDRSLHPGTIIAASLITAINSEAPGPVIAQVIEPVYDSATGQTLLIPQGAKLIGAYKSAGQYGQRRLAILWSRLVFPDGGQIVLNEAAIDQIGAAGIAGKVDNHWGDIFGAAALGTLINMTAAATEDRNSLGLTYNGIGVVEGDDAVTQAARRGVQRTADSVSSRVIERGLAIPPTLKVKAGAKVSVMVTREIGL